MCLNIHAILCLFVINKPGVCVLVFFVFWLFFFLHFITYQISFSLKCTSLREIESGVTDYEMYNISLSVLSSLAKAYIAYIRA